MVELDVHDGGNGVVENAHCDGRCGVVRILARSSVVRGLRAPAETLGCNECRHRRHGDVGDSVAW